LFCAHRKDCFLGRKKWLKILLFFILTVFFDQGQSPKELIHVPALEEVSQFVAHTNKIRSAIISGLYPDAAKESVLVIEEVFRESFQRSLGLVGEQTRTKIREAKQRIAPTQTIEKLRLEKLWALFDETDLFAAYEKATGTDLSAIKALNFTEISSIANKVEESSYKVSTSDILILSQCVERMLEVFGGFKFSTDTPTPKMPPSKEAFPEDDNEFRARMVHAFGSIPVESSMPAWGLIVADEEDMPGAPPVLSAEDELASFVPVHIPSPTKSAKPQATKESSPKKSFSRRRALYAAPALGSLLALLFVVGAFGGGHSATAKPKINTATLIAQQAAQQANQQAAQQAAAQQAAQQAAAQQAAAKKAAAKKAAAQAAARRAAAKRSAQQAAPQTAQQTTAVTPTPTAPQTTPTPAPAPQPKTNPCGVIAKC
jgi:hypothetical protein